MFIKHGDGKIINIIKNDEEMSEEQKKQAQKLAEIVNKQSEQKKENKV